MKDTILKAASANFGVTKPGKRYINRDAWLWNDHVEMKVREKKRLYHKFLDDKTLANNDKNGTLLTNRRTTTDRWREFFEQISTEEFAHLPLSQSLPTFGAVSPASATGAQR